jgi:hypothetical protein
MKLVLSRSVQAPSAPTCHREREEAEHEHEGAALSACEAGGPTAAALARRTAARAGVATPARVHLARVLHRAHEARAFHTARVGAAVDPEARVRLARALAAALPYLAGQQIARADTSSVRAHETGAARDDSTPIRDAAPRVAALSERAGHALAGIDARAATTDLLCAAACGLASGLDATPRRR